MLEEVDAIHIRGGNALFGETTIQGSKNAVLPVMAAALLINDVCTIENCPRILDVDHMKNLLQSLGCKVNRSNRAITIDASCLTDLTVQQEAIRNENVTCMRSSIMLLGAMLGRIGEVSLAYPGGCVIGERPIDLHIRSLKKMGVEFYEEEGYFRAYTRGLKGAVIRLPVASVGATENVILAAVKARGVTVLQNAAKEPEIISLCEFLTKAGAIIEGTGTDTLLIKGLEELHGITYRVPSDRIVAGTYLFSVLGTGGHVFLRDAPVQHMHAILKKAVEMGARLAISREGMSVMADPVRNAVPYTKTEIYPGFPTDMQSPLMAVLTRASGLSLIEETIFENRFQVVPELRSMGADIELLSEHKALIHGVPKLYGKEVSAMELRGGAALIIAGCMADGETVIYNKHFIERGYEDVCRDYRNLGVNIYIGKDTDGKEKETQTSPKE